MGKVDNPLGELEPLLLIRLLDKIFDLLARLALLLLYLRSLLPLRFLLRSFRGLFCLLRLLLILLLLLFTGLIAFKVFVADTEAFHALGFTARTAQFLECLLVEGHLRAKPILTMLHLAATV